MLPGSTCWYWALSSWFHLIRPRRESRLAVDKITCLLTTLYPPFIPGVGSTLWRSWSPWLWKSSHCVAPINLVPLQSVSLLSRHVGAFHLCQFWSISSLPLWPHLPSSPFSLNPPDTSLCSCLFYVLLFFFLHCSLWVHLFPWTAFSSSLLSFLPKILYPVKPSLPTVPSTWVSVFSFPHKKAFIQPLGEDWIILVVPRKLIFPMLLLVQPGKLACLFV